MSDDVEPVEYSLEERLVRALGWSLQFVKPRTDGEWAMLALAKRTWMEGIRAHVEPWVPPEES